MGELRAQLAEQGRRKAVLGLWVKAAVVLAAVSSVGAFVSAVGLLRLYLHPPAALTAPGAARASSSGPWVFGGGASLWASLGAQPSAASAPGANPYPNPSPGAAAARGTGAQEAERTAAPERPAPTPAPEAARDPRRPAEVKDAVPHITVPNLVGMRFRDAQRAMSGLSLSLESGEKKLRTSMKIGWQSVAPGVPIEPGATVRVRKHAP